MKKLLWLAIVFILAGLVLACRPVPAPEVTPAPAVTPAPKTEWEAKWEKIVQDGKKEGIVYLYGPSAPELRTALMDRFPKAYPGIKLDYTALTGGEITPKIKAEHEAGIYNVDLVISGTTTILTGVRPYAQPIKPFLILPEVIDPKAWMGGKLDFADKAEEINLAFTYNARTGLFYNTNLVKPGEITSWWDLVKPKWKGQVVVWDPTVPGDGGMLIHFWYTHPELGPDYFKAFIANEPVITRDIRMQAETVGRGKYSIGAAFSHAVVIELKKAGMPIKISRLLKEGGWTVASFGSVAVMNKLPNPNAATVFLNWVLGKEAQTIFAIKADYFSRRLDVPSDTLDESIIPEPGATYFDTHKEDIVMKLHESAELWKKNLAAHLSAR